MSDTGNRSSPVQGRSAPGSRQGTANSAALDNPRDSPRLDFGSRGPVVESDGEDDARASAKAPNNRTPTEDSTTTKDGSAVSPETSESSPPPRTIEKVSESPVTSKAQRDSPTPMARPQQRHPQGPRQQSPAFRIVGHHEFDEPVSMPEAHFGLPQAHFLRPPGTLTGDSSNRSSNFSQTTEQAEEEAERMWKESEELYKVIQGRLGFSDEDSPSSSKSPTPSLPVPGAYPGTSFRFGAPEERSLTDSPSPAFPDARPTGSSSLGQRPFIGGFARIPVDPRPSTDTFFTVPSATPDPEAFQLDSGTEAEESTASEDNVVHGFPVPVTHQTDDTPPSSMQEERLIGALNVAQPLAASDPKMPEPSTHGPIPVRPPRRSIPEPSIPSPPMPAPQSGLSISKPTQMPKPQSSLPMPEKASTEIPITQSSLSTQANPVPPPAMPSPDPETVLPTPQSRPARPHVRPAPAPPTAAINMPKPKPSLPLPAPSPASFPSVYSQDGDFRPPVVAPKPPLQLTSTVTPVSSGNPDQLASTNGGPGKLPAISNGNHNQKPPTKPTSPLAASHKPPATESTGIHPDPKPPKPLNSLNPGLASTHSPISNSQPHKHFPPASYSDTKLPTKPSKPSIHETSHAESAAAAAGGSVTVAGASQQTRYVKMLLALDDIPPFWNILASFFTWILLAGFLLFPGTFSSWKDEQAAAVGAQVGVTDQLKGTVLSVVSHVPLFVIAFICSGIGVAGMTWLWWRWMANYIWLLNKVFVPGLLNALAGLLSTLTNIFGAQSGQLSTTALTTLIVTASSTGLLLIMVLFYQFWLLRRVQNEHWRQVGKQKAGRHGEGVLKGMMNSTNQVKQGA